MILRDTSAPKLVTIALAAHSQHRIALSLPLTPPVLALTANADDFLPACRDEMAHIAAFMKVRPAASALTESTSPRSRNTALPTRQSSSRRGTVTSFHVASLIFAEIVSHPAIKFQTQTCPGGFDRARQKALLHNSSSDPAGT
jgi:hypothetical protein